MQPLADIVRPKKLNDIFFVFLFSICFSRIFVCAKSFSRRPGSRVRRRLFFPAPRLLYAPPFVFPGAPALACAAVCFSRRTGSCLRRRLFFPAPRLSCAPPFFPAPRLRYFLFTRFLYTFSIFSAKIFPVNFSS